MAGLQERLCNHSKAFDQLLGLIPAKHYFSAGDNSTQWNKRKQTKEESQRAKKAKLDPDLVMSAADIRREQQKKLGENDDEQEKDVEDREGGDQQEEGPLTKKQRKQKRKELAKEVEAATGTAATTKDPKSKPDKHKEFFSEDNEEVEDDGEADEIQLNGFNFSTHLTASPSPQQKPNPIETSKSPAVSSEQRADQRARLAARIEALRAKRRADSPDGTPARNRHELMAARRREEAIQRKERRKEIRLHQKATAEQVKNVDLLQKKSLTPKNEKDSPCQLSGGKGPVNDKCDGGMNRPPHNKDSGKGRKGKVSKKSRPGFEGSLKSSKGKK